MIRGYCTNTVTLDNLTYYLIDYQLFTKIGSGAVIPKSLIKSSQGTFLKRKKIRKNLPQNTEHFYYLK